MLIALFAILLLIFVALLLTGSIRATDGRAFPRSEPPTATPRREFGVPTSSQELFAPRRAEISSEQPGDLFEPGIREFVTPQPDRSIFSSAVDPAPTFAGRGNINWDALHRLTGQPHRTCKCGDCQELRSNNGLDRN